MPGDCVQNFHKGDWIMKKWIAASLRPCLLFCFNNTFRLYFRNAE